MAWTAARNAVLQCPSQNKTNPSIEQIKSKVDGLKMLYKEWVHLGKTSGFGWNEEKELYDAADYVWDNYIKS